MGLKKLLRYGLGWLLVVATVGLIQWGVDDHILFQGLESTIQNDFFIDIRQAHDRITLHKDHFSLRSNERVYLYRYSWDKHLLEWNTNQYVPSEAEVQHLLRNEQNEIHATDKALFYAIKRRTAQHIFIALIPLRIAYPIQNQFLQDYIYLGRWNNWLSAEEINASVKLLAPNQPLESGINIRDENGKVIFGLMIGENHPFRKNLRYFWLLVWIGGFAFGWWQFGRTIQANDPNIPNDQTPFRKLVLRYGIWLSAGILFRFSLYLLPEHYFSGGFFSAHYLAVNEWFASLGDLSLNMVLLLGTVLRGVPLLKNIPYHSFPRSDSDAKLYWYAFFGASVVATILGLTAFFYAFDVLITHSKVYYELLDLSKLDGYSLIFFANILALLVSGTVVLNFLVQCWWHFQQIIHVKIHFIALMVAGVFVCCLLLFPTDDLAFIITGLIFLTALLVMPALRSEERSFLPFVLSLVVWALVTNAAIAFTYYRNLETNMKQIATRFTPQRDLVSEYALEHLAGKIIQDSTLWAKDALYDKPATVRSELISNLSQKYLYSAFRSYDHEVTIFNELGRRLDDQFEIQPLKKEQIGAMQSPTLSRYFVRVMMPGSSANYIGEIPITTSKGRKMIIHIEIRPRTIVEGKLYPQLLLDQRNKQRQSLSQGIDVAYYYGREFVRKMDVRRGNNDEIPFPLALENEESIAGTYRFRKNRHFYEYLRTETNGLTIFVRAPQRLSLDHFTAVSILFYFFALCFIIYYLRTVIRYFVKKDPSYFRHSLVFRIRFYLAFLTVVPLVVVWFLTSNFFRNFFFTETRNNLRQNLELVHKQLQDQISVIEQLAEQDSLPTDTLASDSSREMLISIGNLLSTDINVYRASGVLYSTTKPNIYHDVLVAPYINPAVLRDYQSGYKAEKIITEKIGRLAYESGYLPLSRPYSKEVIGYLNIPFVSQQDTLLFQTERILAYLLNVYLILFLIVLAVSVILTRSLTRPIQLLQNKLENIRLDDATQTEPIEITMKNEIGSLFMAYNRMLVRLFESKNRLALEEREKAYKVMAQQLAHEIKNPLTPMQLHMQMIQRNLREGYDINDDYLQSMSDVILGQIDKLNHIAGTFSRLDSLPAPNILPINVEEFLWDIYELYRDADEAEVVLHTPTEPVYIYADVHQLNQVMVNLVKNALEAMDKRGKVVISVSQDGITGIIKIADNGKGIPSEIKDSLYDFRFTTKKTGSGIGLYLSRKMVLNMNGSIRFESQTGTGTTFYLSFPLVKSDA